MFSNRDDQYHTLQGEGNEGGDLSGVTNSENDGPTVVIHQPMAQKIPSSGLVLKKSRQLTTGFFSNMCNSLKWIAEPSGSSGEGDDCVRVSCFVGLTACLHAFLVPCIVVALPHVIGGRRIGLASSYPELLGIGAISSMVGMLCCMLVPCALCRDGHGRRLQALDENSPGAYCTAMGLQTAIPTFLTTLIFYALDRRAGVLGAAGASLLLSGAFIVSGMCLAGCKGEQRESRQQAGLSIV